MPNHPPFPAWVTDYLRLTTRVVPADPFPENDTAPPAWIDVPPGANGTAEAGEDPDNTPLPIRPLADLEMPAQLALLRLFPVLHAAGLAGEVLLSSTDPLLIEAQDWAATASIQAAVVALVKLYGGGGAGRPKILSWNPKSARDADTDGPRLLQDLARALSEAAPVALVAPTRGSLPNAARDLPWTVVRTGAMDRDRVAALLLARAPGQQTDWTRIRDVLPEDALLRGVGDLSLMAALRAPDTRSVGAALHRVARATPPEFTLKDFAGYGPVFDTARRIADDLRAVAEGRLDPRDIPRNVMFFGPPGTGKTAIAQAIAAAAGVPVVIGSLAEWQAKGHLGDLLAAMFATFGKAGAAAPSVLIIDEIDAFGKRGGDSRNDNYRAQVIAAILQLLDGAYTPSGVTVIACCNYLEQLDTALQRSGRFDLKVRVDAPPPAALAQILRRHLGTDLPGIEADLMPRLGGRSPADIAGAARAARSLARGSGAALSADHLSEALGLTSDDPEARWRVALHEAGHAVMTQVAGFDRIVSLTAGADGGHMLREPGRRRPMLEADLMMDLAVLLSGRVAEILILGAPSAGAGGGAVSDLARATMLARNVEQSCGMGVDGLIWSPVDPAVSMTTALAAAVRKRLEMAEAAAREALEAHRVELLALAELLRAEGHLSGERLSALLPPIRL